MLFINGPLQSMASNIQIEVVYATPERQNIISLAVTTGCTISQAIIASKILHSEIDTMAVGIFGKRRSLDQTLQDGDRVEIYTPLLIDPKQSRRVRAKKSQQAKRRKN